jgi:YVTN family beta-propeller protein
LQVSPDGKRAYITNFGDCTVSVVDTITNSVTAAVAVGGHPEAIAVSAHGERVYVGDYWSGTVTVISAPSVQDESASRSLEKVSAGDQLVTANATVLTLA